MNLEADITCVNGYANHCIVLAWSLLQEYIQPSIPIVEDFSSWTWRDCFSVADDKATCFCRWCTYVILSFSCENFTSKTRFTTERPRYTTGPPRYYYWKSSTSCGPITLLDLNQLCTLEEHVTPNYNTVNYVLVHETNVTVYNDMAGFFATMYGSNQLSESRDFWVPYYFSKNQFATSDGKVIDKRQHTALPLQKYN